MKIRIDKFERLAKERGFRSGYDLAVDIGFGRNAYHYIKKGGKVSSDMVTEIFNRFGEDVAFDGVDFEEDTLEGFASKHIRIGNKLY